MSKKLTAKGKPRKKVTRNENHFLTHEEAERLLELFPENFWVRFLEACARQLDDVEHLLIPAEVSELLYKGTPDGEKILRQKLMRGIYADRSRIWWRFQLIPLLYHPLSPEEGIWADMREMVERDQGCLNERTLGGVFGEALEVSHALEIMDFLEANTELFDVLGNATKLMKALERIAESGDSGGRGVKGQDVGLPGIDHASTTGGRL